MTFKASDFKGDHEKGREMTRWRKDTVYAAFGCQHSDKDQDTIEWHTIIMSEPNDDR